MSDEAKPQIARGAKTNRSAGSLVKVVAKEEDGRWKHPAPNESFYISEDAEFPEIKFEFDSAGSEERLWSWAITWSAATSGLRESAKRGKTLKTYQEAGKCENFSNFWKADLNGHCVGGTLTVCVKIGGKLSKRSVRILGKNPGEQRVKEYLATFADVPGLERLVEKESKFKQFIDADGEPVVAFDGGYGLAQLTNPLPKYVHAWDWKANIQAAVDLYKMKRKEAKNHLSKNKRNYTEEQLQLETWCLWNSGHYHVWDDTKKQWIRDPSVQGDTKTGNIGWDMRKPENEGKSEKDLHERDKDKYSRPPSTTDSWRYSGVVYADHVKN